MKHLRVGGGGRRRDQQGQLCYVNVELDRLAERKCLPPMIAIFGEAIVGNLSVKGVEQWGYSINDCQGRIGVAVQRFKG